MPASTGRAYVTNAVKHFKFTQPVPGKRRIHAKPDAWEVAACRPWLSAELALLQPQVVVALGATAALLGKDFRVSNSEGAAAVAAPAVHSRVTRTRCWTRTHRQAAFVLATLHPSAVLRLTTGKRRTTARHDLSVPPGPGSGASTGTVSRES